MRRGLPGRAHATPRATKLDRPGREGWGPSSSPPSPAAQDIEPKVGPRPPSRRRGMGAPTVETVRPTRWTDAPPPFLPPPAWLGSKL